MRNLCCKCPHYYEQHGYECDDVDWGCTAFGREFENCPSFDDGEGNADFEEWGCNEKQNRIQYTLMQIRKKSHALGKIGYEKERRFYKKIYSVLPKEEKGYKAYKDGKFQGFLTHDYRPNMKGGHRHNHIRNAHKRMRKCHVCGEPIVWGCEVIGYRFNEFQCRSCRTEECREYACLVGLSFGGCEFETRRRRK